MRSSIAKHWTSNSPLKKYSSPLKQEKPKGKFSERKELYPGEDAYFKKNPNVGGMAAEDNRVIINPYSSLSNEEKNAIRTNETARLYMRNSESNERPNMRLRRSQKKSFSTVNNGSAYSEDPQDIKETIVARIISGDKSAGKTTVRQRKYAEKLKRKIESDTL